MGYFPLLAWRIILLFPKFKKWSSNKTTVPPNKQRGGNGRKGCIKSDFQKIQTNDIGKTFSRVRGMLKVVFAKMSLDIIQLFRLI